MTERGLGTLDATNFREFAEKCIQKYFDSGRLVDALVWRSIIGHYETALAGKTPMPCNGGETGPCPVHGTKCT